MTVFMMTAAICIFGINAKAAAITQTNQTESSVTISWPAANNVKEYYVGIGTDYSTAADSATISVPASSLSYTFTGLKGGSKYVVCVKYASTLSSTVYNLGSQDIKTLPSKVSGVNQTKWWYFVQSVDFAWEEQSAARYEYIVRNNNNKVVRKETDCYSNKGSLPKTSNNIVYNVQVRAYVTIGGKEYYGKWSDKAYLFTQPMVKKAYLSKNKLKITWSKVKGITRYDVYVSTKEKSGYKKVKSLGSKKTSVSVSKLKGKKFSAKKTYYIYLVGKKKVGNKTYTSGRLYTYKLTNGKNGQLHWTYMD